MEAAQHRDEDRARFSLSIEARLLYDRIRVMKAGETVTYGELSRIIDRDVQGECRGALRTARRLAQRDDDIVTDAVIGLGIKRLSDGEIVESGAGIFQRTRRLARRGVERLMAPDYDALPPEQKLRRDASLAALSAIDLFAKPGSIRRITAANTTGPGVLSVDRTLELFQRRSA